MSDQDFIPLHVHSTYSILESLSKIGHLVQETVRQELKALALTDYDSICGMSEFKVKADNAKIKPIFGCDLCVSSKVNEDDTSNLVLLAYNEKGWRNLVRIHNHAWKNLYRRPTTTYKKIEECKDGLLCILGGTNSDLYKAKEKDENNFLDYILNLFGDNLYLELVDNSSDFTVNNLNSYILSLNLPYVITNNILYTKKDDFKTYNILTLIKSKKTRKDVEEGKAEILVNNEFYFKTVEEIKKNYPEEVWNKSLESYRKIYNKIENILILDKPHLPKISDNPKKEILDIIKDNLKKIPLNNRQVYFDRIKKEMKVYEKTNSLNYLLIVRDFLKWADDNKYLRNFGRGSACSSLVTYLMNIHYIDPIKFDLYFDRFINENRGIKMKVF
jgi:DNA polymerase-3 subunit alpha